MTLTVKADSAGARADVFVAEHSGLTRARVQKMLEDGAIFVGGERVHKSYRVKEGDEVSFDIPAAEPCEAGAENIPLDIIYEDADIIVVNKQKGLVVHPAAGNMSGTLVNALLYHCGESLSGIGGVLRPGIVHRIDKNTSGLIVAAKNDAAHLSLSRQIKDHEARRIYHAIAVGKISGSSTLDFPIGRNTSDRKKMAVTGKNSKRAVTHLDVIEELSGATYIKCSLETGRTHQIRVHLSHIGHPILGDAEYGGAKNPITKKYGAATNGQYLHAKELTLTHPRTGEVMTFTSPLPDYFEKMLGYLRGTN